MQLGKFSVSLSVQSLSVSRAFYEKLGFQHIAGEEAHRYLILQNGEATIGLFEGMFEGNILTFNPGWGPQGEELEDFEDVRVLQAKLEEAGIQLTEKADLSTTLSGWRLAVPRWRTLGELESPRWPHSGSLASLHLGARAKTLGLRPPPRPSHAAFVRP
jgi:hypothetical protein